MDEFLNDDRSYRQWLEAHPKGYVINSNRRPGASYLVLHRATCWTISRLFGRGNSLTAYRKTCFRTRQQAVNWGGGQWPGALQNCSFCRP